jgi:hypothetical protein
MLHECPPGCETKFADFIRLCAETKANGVPNIAIPYPWVIGDIYDEVIESLGRPADAGLTLYIAARKDYASSN